MFPIEFNLDTSEMILVGVGVAMFLMSVVGLFIMLRYFHRMQRNIEKMHESHVENQEALRQLQTSTQQDIRQLQASTQEDIRQLLTSTQQDIRQLQASTQQDIHNLQLAQTSMQTMVSVTQHETQQTLRDLSSMQNTSQTVMQEVKTLYSSSQALMIDWQKETAQLSRALRSNYQQGMWGEYQLQRVVELAGMVQHCDFELQPTLPDGQKPDMVISMHNNRKIAVDAKAPSHVYLEAMKCEAEGERAKKLQAYVKSVKDMMHELAAKRYWKELDDSLALTILFIPNEAMFRAALEYDLTLLDISTQKNVLLASPLTLIALLKTIANGWSHHHRAENVQHIVEKSKDLHKELESWVSQWKQLRKGIYDVTAHFNCVVTSYEASIFPLMKEISSYDDTLVFKEKVLALKEIKNTLKPLDDQEEQREEKKEETFQGKLTRSLEKFKKDVLTVSFPDQK